MKRTGRLGRRDRNRTPIPFQTIHQAPGLVRIDIEARENQSHRLDALLDVELRNNRHLTPELLQDFLRALAGLEIFRCPIEWQPVSSPAMFQGIELLDVARKCSV